MEEAKDWCSSRIDGKKISEGECTDRVLSREEIIEELGPGYKAKR